jgi:Uma2 family endonuclease
VSNTVRKPHLLTPEDYLAFEAEALEKHEYVDGEIYAMTGTTVKHNRISLNLAFALKQHLTGQPCETFMADLKVHAAAANAFYYPDLVVRCQAQPLTDETRIITDPTLIVEVLSPSTEATDRREKLAAYRRIPSLQEYVLIAQDECSVEIYRRNGDIGWHYLAFTDNDSVEFASIGLSLPMATIYGAT